MKKLPVLLVSLVFVSAVTFSAVSARSVEKGAHKPMNPCQIAEMKKKKHAMRKEMHDIMRDTIALIKEIAPDDVTKAKAVELEKRMQKHIDGMEAHHKEMKGKYGKKMKGK